MPKSRFDPGSTKSSGVYPAGRELLGCRRRHACGCCLRGHAIEATDPGTRALVGREEDDG